MRLEPDKMPSDKVFASRLGISPRQFRRLKVKMLENNMMLKQDEVIIKSQLIPEVINQEGNSTNADIIPDLSIKEEVINTDTDDDDCTGIWRWS
jgi:hypothetical protein